MSLTKLLIQSYKFQRQQSIDTLATLISGSANTEGIKTLEKLLAWPHEYVFPALDILRITIRNPEVCKYFSSSQDCVDLLCQHASEGNPLTCRMLAMSTFANFFRYPEGIELNMRHIDAVLQSAINCKDFNTKNAQVADASLILNYCIRLSSLDDLESKSKCLQAIIEILVVNLDLEAA